MLSEIFLNNTTYSFDEKTGAITAKKDYNGTNILIKLNLDKTKADPKKSEEYLNKLKENENVSDDSGGTEGAEDTDVKEIVITQEMVNNAILKAGK